MGLFASRPSTLREHLTPVRTITTTKTKHLNGCIDVNRVAELFWKWLFCLDSRCAGMRRLGTGVFLMTNKYSQLYSTGATTDEKMVLNLQKKKKSQRFSITDICILDIVQASSAQAHRGWYSQLFITSDQIRGSSSVV